MTIIVKIEPTVRAGDHTSHFVAVFHFDGKNFVDSGKRLHVGVNGIPNQVGEEPLYSEGRAVLLVEGWSDGSMESGERCPDIIPLIDRYKKPDSKPVSGEVAEAVAYWETRVETYGFCKRDMDTLKVILQAAQSHHPAEDSKPQDVSGLVEALEPFAAAFEKANNVVSSGIPYSDRISHIVRATTYWLSFNDFDRLSEALKTFKGEA